MYKSEKVNSCIFLVIPVCASVCHQIAVFCVSDVSVKSGAYLLVKRNQLKSAMPPMPSSLREKLKRAKLGGPGEPESHVQVGSQSLEVQAVGAVEELCLEVAFGGACANPYALSRQ